MTQLHFTLNIKDIQNLINTEVKNDITILTKVFNELMEKERDEYLENTDYKRNPNRITYRNGYYELGKGHLDRVLNSKEIKNMI